MANKFAVAAGTWDASDTTIWSDTDGGAPGAVAPTSSDDVFINANAGGGTITIGTGAVCRHCDATGSPAKTIAGGVALTIHGSLTLVSNITLTYTGAFTFVSTSTGRTITSAGLTIQSSIVFDGVGGGWTFQDDLTTAVGKTITLSKGALDTNGKAISAGGFTIGAVSTTRSLVCGASTLTVSGAAGFWNAGTTTGLTFDAGTSTIKFTGDAGNNKTFTGGGLTYNNVTFSGSGTGKFIVSGSNTFNVLTVDTPPHTLQITAGTTQTMSSFVFQGLDGNAMTLESSSGGSAFTFTKSTAGVVSCRKTVISDCTATEGGTWFAGSGSTDGGGNTNWIFSDAYSGSRPDLESVNRTVSRPIR